MPSKEQYAMLKAKGVCARCWTNPVEHGKSKCKACDDYQREYRKTPQYREHQREFNRKYRKHPEARENDRIRKKTPEYREIHRRHNHKYRNRIYGIYCCYMPQLDQFKLGYGGVYGRLGAYRVTDPNTTIVAYTELSRETAKREERKILRETLIYNSNGSRKSEMRLNCAPVRQYVKDNFEVINDETILNIRAQKRIVQAKL